MSSANNGLLPEGWQRAAVAQVAEVIGGGTPSTNDPDNFDGSIAWLTPKDLSGYERRYISHGERSISEKGLARSSARKLPAGTVLLTSRAPVGYVAIASAEVTTNQGFKSLRLKDGHDPEFFYYLLKANRAALESRASGSTFKELSGSVLKQIEFAVPPVPEQKRIARVLGSLDDKSESNQNLAAILFGVVETRFRWQFAHCAVNAFWAGATAETLPEGWSVGSLGDVAEITMGQSPPGSSYSDDPAHGVPLVQGMGKFGSRFPRLEVFTDRATRIAKAGSVLMTVRAPVGAVNIAPVDLCLGRGVAGLTSPQGAFLEFLVRSLQARWAAHEAGTIFSAVNKKQITGLPIPIPPDAEIAAFERFARPIIEMLTSLLRQMELLASARESLLPKLISGRIRVPDTTDPEEALGVIAEEAAV